MSKKNSNKRIHPLKKNSKKELKKNRKKKEKIVTTYVIFSLKKNDGLYPLLTWKKTFKS